MKRIDFLRTIGTLTAGAYATQASALGNGLIDIAASKRHLATAAPQVRHGLLQLQPILSDKIPHWLQAFRPMHFFRNGIDKSDGDLRLFPLSIDHRDLQIGLSTTECWIATDENIVTSDLRSELTHPISCEFKIHISPLKAKSECLIEPSGSTEVWIMLKGSAQAASKIIDEHEVIEILNLFPRKIKSLEESLLLRITKTQVL